MAAKDNDEIRLARRVRIGRLLEVYGQLLTERQRDFVRLHHHDDLSFGEIAHETGVSRQAVHDAVSQAEAAMEHYERCLGLLGRTVAGHQPGQESAGAAGAPRSSAIEAARGKIEHLRRRLASQGIIYDASEYVRALDEVLDQLQGQ